MRALIICSVVSLTGCGARSSAELAESSEFYEAGCASLGAQAFLQGPLNATGLPSDLALDGAGFFVLADDRGTWFSRNGAFTINARGAFEQIPTGARLQKVGGGDLTLGNQLMPPMPTANVTLKGNLDSDAPVQVFNPTDPANTSSGQSTTTVYDSLGKAYSVDVYWTKSGSGTWEFHAMTDGGSIAGGTAGTPSEIANGTIDFDQNGRLINFTHTSNFFPASATEPQSLSFNLGDPLGTAGGTGLAGVTQFRAPSSTTFAGQDGAPAGTLSNFAVSVTGQVLGSFSNGVTSVLGSVSTAVFPAPQALRHRGDGVFMATVASGDPVLGFAGDTVRPAIVGGALERLPKYSCSGN